MTAGPSASRTRAIVAVAVAVLAMVGVMTTVPASATPSVATRSATPPELAKGSKGDPVKVLQKALKIKPISGYFGPVTEIAVKAFQRRVGLTPSGVVDAATWQALGPKVSRQAARGATPGSGTREDDGRFCPAETFTYGDRFGAPRGGRAHMGLDLMGKRGTPIYAVDAGTVTRSGYQSNGAIILDISGPKGMWFYGHFDKVLFRNGQKVQAGQLIGYMGDTGSPGAVHLHIEYRPNGWSSSAVNPESIIRAACGD